MSELGFGLLRPTQVINLLLTGTVQAKKKIVLPHTVRAEDFILDIGFQIQQFIAFWSQI